jgi:hypothetical protein
MLPRSPSPLGSQALELPLAGAQPRQLDKMRWVKEEAVDIHRMTVCGIFHDLIVHVARTCAWSGRRSLLLWKLSDHCLGAPQDRGEAVRVLRRAVELGVDFIGSPNARSGQTHRAIAEAGNVEVAADCYAASRRSQDPG